MGVRFELVVSSLLSFSWHFLRFCSLLAEWGSDWRTDFYNKYCINVLSWKKIRAYPCNLRHPCSLPFDEYHFFNPEQPCLFGYLGCLGIAEAPENILT